MHSDLPADLSREDQQLRVGSRVIACWSRDGFSYRGPAVVVRLEPLRAEVRLLAPLAGSRDRPRLRTLTLPRYSNFMEWSSGCCLRLERR